MTSHAAHEQRRKLHQCLILEHVRHNDEMQIWQPDNDVFMFSPPAFRASLHAYSHGNTVLAIESAFAANISWINMCNSNHFFEWYAVCNAENLLVWCCTLAMWISSASQMCVLVSNVPITSGHKRKWSEVAELTNIADCIDNALKYSWCKWASSLKG